MKKILIALSALLIYSCEKETTENPLNDSVSLRENNFKVSTKNKFVGAIYAMNNNQDSNTIISYGRNKNGKLSFISATETGGNGSGPTNILAGSGGDIFDPLSSNYSVIMSPNKKLVFAVNAGSNEISSFLVKKDFSLKLISKISSGGVGPVSLAINKNSLYVVNVNQGTSTLAGFKYNKIGKLIPINNSKRTLTGRATAIQFSRDGNLLVATEIDTQRLQVYRARPNNGLLSRKPFTFEYPEIEGRNTANPFGLFTFSSNNKQFVTISEARIFNSEGAPALQTSSLSTFRLLKNGRLIPVSLDTRVDNDGDDTQGGLASCWVVQNNQNQAFSINTISNDIATLKIAPNGKAKLIAPQAYVEPGPFIEAGLTDVVAIDNNVYQMLSVSGAIISLKTSRSGQLSEFDRDTNLSTSGGNQGITGF